MGNARPKIGHLARAPHLTRVRAVDRVCRPREGSDARAGEPLEIEKGEENRIMADSKADARFDALVSQVHDWTESAVALDEGHFPGELLSDLRDLIEELKAFLEEAEPGPTSAAT
jgi:hypothetical protein